MLESVWGCTWHYGIETQFAKDPTRTTNQPSTPDSIFSAYQKLDPVAHHPAAAPPSTSPFHSPMHSNMAPPTSGSPNSADPAISLVASSILASQVGLGDLSWRGCSVDGRFIGLGFDMDC